MGAPSVGPCQFVDEQAPFDQLSVGQRTALNSQSKKPHKLQVNGFLRSRWSVPRPNKTWPPRQDRHGLLPGETVRVVFLSALWVAKSSVTDALYVLTKAT